MRSTSLDAYNEVKPQLGQRQREVYDAIKELGSVTNNELSHYLRLPINQITPRTNELVKMGYVMVCEKRECSISKKTVLSWRVR